MSVLIKGIKMPKNCFECFLRDGLFCVASDYKQISYGGLDKKEDWCPLLLLNNKINKLMMSLEETIKKEREMAVKSLSLSVDNPRHVESVHNAYANGMENALKYIIYYLGDFIDECDN